MKSTAKRLGSLAVCGALMLSLTSCTGTPKESTPPTSGTPAPTNQVTTTPAPSQDQPAAGVTAGTYTATAPGYADGDVVVDVTVDASGKITDLQVVATTQTASVGQAAAPQMVQNILDSQRLDCDTVTGATQTCAAILAGVEDALTQAGVDTAALKSEAVKADDEEVTVEIAVVGAGASGTAAAAAAFDTGAKSVLMVEMTSDVGGISKLWAGGPFAVESHLQKEAGGQYAELTSEQLFQTINDYAHFVNYAPLTKAVVYGSADTIEFMENWGVTFHVNDEAPQVAHRDDPLKWMIYHWYDTFTYDHKPGDMAAIDYVHENLQKAGLDLRFNTICTGLLQDADGKVSGIVCTKEDGSTLTVHADQVILGTGGFAGNTEMSEQWFHTNNIRPMGMDGSGMQMAWNAGAARWDTNSSLFHGVSMLPATNPTETDISTSPFSRVLKSPLMWVDQSGNRYCNEEAIWDSAWGGNTAYSVGGMFYILVDTATLQTYTDGNNTIQMDTAVGGPNMEPGDFIALAEEGVTQGNIIKADTVEGLAEALGMKAERLAASVDEYNTAVETKDDPFGKSAASLLYPVSDGPFYAIPMKLGTLGTLGGVRVNEELQACDQNLNPIPGLYVVGNDAGGFYGAITGYPPYEGLATGFAWGSGKIAGRSAAAQLGA